jgi:molybdate transport system regulatory protein
MEAIRELGLEVGKPAVAVIKASNVMFAAGDQKLALSARNQFCGTVTKLERGAVNGRVAIQTACGKVFSGSITNEAIEELGLEVGKPAVAVVKSTDVLVAVEE